MAFLWSISNVCLVTIEIISIVGVVLFIHVKFVTIGDVLLLSKI